MQFFKQFVTLGIKNKGEDTKSSPLLIGYINRLRHFRSCRIISAIKPQLRQTSLP